MSFIKRHPALAALIALGVLIITAPLAYAVVDRVFLSVDADKSAPEIEQGLTSQLGALGIPATVTAEKRTDGRVQIQIESDALEAADLGVSVTKNGAQGSHQLAVRMEHACDLTPDQAAALKNAVTSPPFIDALMHRALGGSDPDLVTALRKILADHGFHDVDIQVTADELVITVTAPPR